jgi:hypothetical protein
LLRTGWAGQGRAGQGRRGEERRGEERRGEERREEKRTLMVIQPSIALPSDVGIVTVTCPTHPHLKKIRFVVVALYSNNIP